jgi:Domain of unknown function (DUF1963)
MDEITLSKKQHDPAGDLMEAVTVFVVGTTLHWLRQYSRRESDAWYVKKRDQGSKNLETAEEAEAAARAMIAELEGQGFVAPQPVQAPPPEAPSAAKKGAKKPAWFGALPKPQAVQHGKLQKTATAKGLAHRFPEIEALMRPGIDLALKKAKPADLKGVVSRLGGEPDLPTKQPWPEANGVPLTFVGQIVITPEIKELDLEGILPKEGVLSFFAQLDSDAPEYGETGAILLFPSASGLVRTAPPAPQRVHAQAGVFTPKGRLAVAVSEHPDVEALGLNRNEQRAYHDNLFLGPIPEGRHHMLIGWADATTHHDYKKKRFVAQFDSDHRIDFEMGDYETLRFYVDGDKIDAKTVKTAVCTLSEA